MTGRCPLHRVARSRGVKVLSPCSVGDRVATGQRRRARSFGLAGVRRAAARLGVRIRPSGRECSVGSCVRLRVCTRGSNAPGCPRRERHRARAVASRSHRSPRLLRTLAALYVDPGRAGALFRYPLRDLGVLRPVQIPVWLALEVVSAGEGPFRNGKDAPMSAQDEDRGSGSCWPIGRHTMPQAGAERKPSWVPLPSPERGPRRSRGADGLSRGTLKTGTGRRKPWRTSRGARRPTCSSRAARAGGRRRSFPRSGLTAETSRGWRPRLHSEGSVMGRRHGH